MPFLVYNYILYFKDKIIMELTFEVKEFIEDNIDLIEDRAWDQVYDNARFNLDSESMGLFTEAILSIGETPLDVLEYIPDYYYLILK